jgi:urease accessory protein UreH
MASDNRIEIENINGNSQSTTLICHNPHKWIPTRSRSGEYRVFSSSYGGGLVQGDHVNIDINVLENAHLCIQSQGNQHVYKNVLSQSKVIQKYSINLSKKSKLAILTDPVVLHQGADFSQSISINIDRTSEFLIIDSFTSGRHECGESYLFNTYDSSLAINIDNKLSMLENFGLEPHKQPCQHHSSCSHYTYFVNIYGFGVDAELWLKRCWNFGSLPEKKRINELNSQNHKEYPQICFSFNHDDETGLIQARCFAEKRFHLDFFIQQLISTSEYFFNN